MHDLGRILFRRQEPPTILKMQQGGQCQSGDNHGQAQNLPMLNIPASTKPS
jgi:hypothetical protein